MPEGFNRLLVTHAMTVTDTNIIEMAEAFVSVAVGNGLITGRGGYQRRPGHVDTTVQITFLKGHRHAVKKVSHSLIHGEYYDLMREAKVGKQSEERWFSVWQGQLSYALREGPEGYINHYMPVPVESLPGRK